MRTPIIAVATAVLAALCPAPVAFAQESDEAPPPFITLEYRVTTERAATTEAERKGKPLVPHAESTMRVTLGPRVVEVAEPEGRRMLLDYESGWAHEIDDAAGTYRSIPLIAEEARAPASLRFRWHDVGQRTTATWTLVSCTRGTARPKGVDGLERDFPDDAVGRLARRVLASDDETPKRLSHDELQALSNEARDAGHPEDAALLLLESSLQDASDVTPAIRALLSDADRATRIRAIMGSVTLANSDPEKGIAELDAFDRATLTHPAILDVFRANGLANLGRTADAVEAFESALRELPWLSAAYCDLGHALHRGFRVDEAWLAWEAGRAVGAEHPTWRSVQGLEEHLRDVFGELL